MYWLFTGIVPQQVPEGDLDLLQDLGLSLFGDRWQAQFCAKSGIATSQLSAILKGKQPLSKGVKAKIVAMLESNWSEMIESAAYQSKLINASQRRFAVAFDPDLVERPLITRLPDRKSGRRKIDKS